MKKTFTLNFLSGVKQTTVLALAGILFVISMVLVGCYEFRTINQPGVGSSNSYFDVPIIAQRDQDPSLDEGSWDLAGSDIGLFGVMIPDGWSVDDSIAYTIVSKNASLTNSGFLVHNAEHSKTLTDSIAPIPGYHWWGAITDRMAEMTSFDSLYFTPRIHTDSKTGSFFLRYAIGDKNYWDRNPADQFGFGGGLSDPIEIKISDNVGLTDLLSKANVSMYPNPTKGVLHVNLSDYKSQTIKMNVYDTKGQLVMTKQILKSANVFNLSTLPKGSYVVELKSGNKKSSSRIVVN